MNVCICYFGMPRSTRHVYQTHIENLHNVLKDSSINFKIFFHTWKTENNIVWNTNYGPIDNEEYKFLNPDFYKIESQDEFLSTIQFDNYFDKQLYDTYGDSPYSEWRPYLIKNHLCALESQKRVFNMVLENGTPFDYIIVIRPDVKILNKFDVQCLFKNYDITILNYDNYEGLNDKFAVLPFYTANRYMCRIDEIIEFRKTMGRIVSEKYVKYIIEKYYKKVDYIDFQMVIIRPDNTIVQP